MRVLLVAYTSAGNNYKEFAISLRKLGEKWWHYMDHIWLLKTDKTAEEVWVRVGRDGQGRWWKPIGH